MLRTRAPLSSPPKRRFSFDLHVLSPPQTFALSQDQTLQFELCSSRPFLGLCSILTCRSGWPSRTGLPCRRDENRYRLSNPTRLTGSRLPPSNTVIRFVLVRLSSFQGACPLGFGGKPRRLEAVSYGSAFELQAVFRDQSKKSSRGSKLRRSLDFRSGKATGGGFRGGISARAATANVA